MSKIQVLRRRVAEQFNAFELENAAESGEALLREHWNNHSMRTIGYASDIYNLARVYDEMGNLERAVELYADGANMFARQQANSVVYTNCLNNLAAALHGLGMEEGASHLFGQLVAVKRHFGAVNEPHFADSLYNLANASADVGRTHQARKWHKEALEIREASKDTSTQDIIDSLHSLAFLHEENKEYEKAASLAETAKDLSQGDDYACSCYYLAGLYNALGLFEKALSLYEEVMELTCERVSRAHHSYLDVAAKRAVTLDKMGRPREALVIQMELRAIFEGLEISDNAGYTKCLHHMATLYHQLGESEKTEMLLLNALKINRKNDRQASDDIAVLIRLYLHKQEKEKALEMLVYALMHSEARGPGLAQLLTKMAEAFNYPQGPGTEAMINALREMNDRKKLHPIIEKWARWENEPFIPAFLMQPPTGQDMM